MMRRLTSLLRVRISAVNNPSGFTIVEVLIVLTVSVALYLSAIALLGGSQGKTQFYQALDDVNQNFTAIINNVSNGYYPRVQGITSCNISGDPIVVGTDPLADAEAGRGTIDQCIFIGRMVQFFEDEDYYNVYSVAGARVDSAGKEVDSLGASKPAIIDSADKTSLKNGLTLKSIKVNAPGSVESRYIGFFTNFGSYDADQLRSGTLVTDYTLVPNVGLSGEDAANALSSLRSSYNTNKNPSEGITLCFQSGTTDQFGRIVIGGENSGINTTVTINKEACT